MKTKVISFLGYTPPGSSYRETTYFFEEKEHFTPFMTEAAAHFFKPDVLLVLVTSEAKAQNFSDLEKKLQGVIRPQPIDIPSGKQEDELWEIFRIIADCIEQDDTIIFDITNGFRSLPVLAFLAASYVRLVRGATVKQMVYGAFDAKDEEKNRTPVFDLTPFLSLLDWTTATNAFLKSGQADDLSKLLRTGSSLPNIGYLADRMENLSLALHTSRPTSVMQAASGLDKDLAQVKPHITGNTRPFTLLLDKINEEYSSFGLEEPMDTTNAKQVLERLLNIIEWYVDKNLLIQAITLAREWLVTLVVYHSGGDLFDEQDRDTANRRNMRNNPAIKRIWTDLQAKDLRNDIAHCGMRKDPRAPQEVVGKVKEICSSLRDLLCS